MIVSKHQQLSLVNNNALKLGSSARLWAPHEDATQGHVPCYAWEIYPSMIHPLGNDMACRAVKA